METEALLSLSIYDRLGLHGETSTKNNTDSKLVVQYCSTYGSTYHYLFTVLVKLETTLILVAQAKSSAPGTEYQHYYDHF